MFKSGRWRSEKNKIKAVFRLQFHATEVLLSEGDLLMMSIIPADVGKPTTKMGRVKVDNGVCYWEKAVYETVKFSQDLKTGKVNERLYHFMIATGLSKSGTLGEVHFDFANYALATKLSTVSIPLKTAKLEAILHVSIERIQDSVDQREVYEVEPLKHGSQDHSLRTQSSNSDMDQEIKAKSAEDGSSDKIITHVAQLKQNYRASIGSDVSISSSDSISRLDTSQEFGIKNSITEDQSIFISSLDHASLLQKPISDASTTIYRQQSEYSGGSAPDASTDDSSNSPRETLIRESSHGNSDILIQKLKTEIVILARKSEVSELELQTLRKNIVKETKRGHDLSRELITVKEERDAFREECERLEDFQKHSDATKVQNKLQVDEGDPWAVIEELRQEVNHEKNLNANLRIQLRKTQESKFSFAERDLDELLEERDSEIINVSKKSANSQNMNNLHVYDADVDEDQKALEELVKEHRNDKGAYLLEQKVVDLCSEIDICRRDRDDLEMQMEQLSLDYEILRQENHDILYKLEQSQLQEQLKMQYECSTSYATVNELESQVESLENQLTKQSEEFSASLITISELENHVKKLEEELEKQAQGFESDIEELINAKVQQEKRAIQAEETLRKAQRQNVNTAERIQKEFRGLYTQMSSTFDANDKLATKALTEANEIRLQKKLLEQTLQQANNELHSVRDLHEAKLLELSSQIFSKTKQMEQMQSEMEHKSTEIKNHRKHAEETRLLLSEEILMLQSKIGRLTHVNNVFSEQEKQNETLRAELEQMKASIKENENLTLKGAGNSKDINPNDKITEAATILAEDLSVTEGTSGTLRKSSNDISLENELRDSATYSRDQGNSDKLPNEMELLKERNQSMEGELKDMQERYSEISLKFAEVEGERQKLVMELRSTKNSKKSPS